MATEIEAKMAVDDLDAVRASLSERGGERVVQIDEVNVFLDSPGGELTAEDKGLRVRLEVHDGDPRIVSTFKGPRQAGVVKKRLEINVTVDDLDAMCDLLGQLGYFETLRFEKTRERWSFNQCQIELDLMPKLGSFVEIEGPSEQIVLETRELLTLTDKELTSDSYASMVAAYFEANPTDKKRLVFDA